MPFRDGAFDSILCTQVLDDVQEPARVLKEFHRVLREGGTLVLTVPQSWGDYDPLYDFWRFTERGLRYLLTTSGFTVETLRRRGGIFVSVSERVSVFLWLSWWGQRAILPVRVLVVAVCGAVQLLGEALDVFDRDRTDTLGYTVLARRVPSWNEPFSRSGADTSSTPPSIAAPASSAGRI
jgi:SAM-dependent methyltransferase